MASSPSATGHRKTSSEHHEDETKKKSNETDTSNRAQPYYTNAMDQGFLTQSAPVLIRFVSTLIIDVWNFPYKYSIQLEFKISSCEFLLRSAILVGGDEVHVRSERNSSFCDTDFSSTPSLSPPYPAAFGASLPIIEPANARPFDEFLIDKSHIEASGISLPKPSQR